MEQTLNPTTTDSSGDPSETTTPQSKFRKRLGLLGWFALGLFFFILFTLLKLPDDRIRGNLETTIGDLLAEKGITIRFKESSLSYLFGIRYKMTGVTLEFPPPTPPAAFEEIKIAPSLLGVFLGRFGASIEITQKKGNLSAYAWVRHPKTAPEINLDLKLQQFDLGRAGLIAFLSGVNLSIPAVGTIVFSGLVESPDTWNGSIDLKLSPLEIPAQSISGFGIPALAIGGGNLELSIDKGKVLAKSVAIGKLGNATDDLAVKATGGITFQKFIAMSQIDSRIQLGLSQKVLSSFALIDAILGPGKQTDQTYLFDIKGTLSAPVSQPVPPTQ